MVASSVLHYMEILSTLLTEKNKGNHFGYQVFHHVQLLNGVSRSVSFN